jgi:hypothetical protein
VALVRRKSAHATPRPQPSLEPGNHATEFAWRIHAAQEAWANKSDVKASILLALEGGALFAVIAASSKGGLLTGLRGWRHIAEMSGLGLLLLAVASAAIAVFPMLGRVKSLQASASSHVIYFGHLRYWDPLTLKGRLESLTADQALEALSRQLVEMAKSNWGKHRWIQASLGIAMLAILIIAIAAIAAF